MAIRRKRSVSPADDPLYLFNYAVAGAHDRPAGYHWFNLLLHAINVLLVARLVLRLTGHSTAAVAAASIWAVVPLSSEAVTNIVGRADLMAAFGVIAGLLCYLEARATSGTRRRAWLLGLMAATAVGVFSKESAVAIAGVIVACELVWWTPAKSARTLAAAAVAMAPPMLLMWYQRFTVLSAAGIAEFPFLDNPIAGAGFWVGRLTALKVMGHYLWLLVWPSTLSIDYSFNQIPLAQGSAADWIVALAVVALVGSSVALRRRQSAAFFFCVFAALTFLPVSNLLFATGTIMAERLMYLPSAGLAAVFVLLLFGRGPGPTAEPATGPGPMADSAHPTQSALRHVVPVAVSAAMVVAFATRTWLRNNDWQDDVRLWTAAVEASPSSAKAHRALAEALYDADPSRANIDRVIAEAEASVALLAPLSDELSSFQSYRQAGAYHLDKGDALGGSGTPGAIRTDEARRSYGRALALLQRGLAVAAAVGSRAGADSSRQQSDAERLIAAAHLKLGEPAAAADAGRHARQLDPVNPIGHRVLADALLAAGRRDDAAVALMVGSMVTSDARFRADLIDLYRAAPDRGGCAIATTANGAVLDPACPAVRSHLCAASAESVALNLRAGRRAEAEQLRSVAEKQLGCARP